MKQKLKSHSVYLKSSLYAFKFLLIFTLSIICTNSVNAKVSSNTKTTIADNKSTLNKTISGTIKNTTGVSIPGVNVIVDGLTKGTVSDINGNFKIEMPENADVLVFSFIGMKTKKVPIGNKSVFNVIMEEDAIAMEQVVVVGYGTQKKSKVTGSVSVADLKTLGSQSPVYVSQYLQGIAGVQVVNSGDPGAAPIIRIRGINSLINNSPLYVLDGIPVADFRDFNPSDIESISVLKDAASASIYGSRAANGVILLTSKKGKNQDKLRVELNVMHSKSTPSKLLELGNAQDFAKWDNLAMDNAGLPHISSSDLALSDPVNSPNSDWQKAFFQEGTTNQYDLNLSGGSTHGTWRVSAGHLSKEGIVIGPKFERNTLTLGNDYNYGHLKFGFNVRLAWQDATDNVNGVGVHSPVADVVWALPTVKIYDEANTGGYGRGTADNPTYMMNPIGVHLKYNNTYQGFKAQNNFFAEYEIVSGLKFKTTIAVPYTTALASSRTPLMLLKQVETLDSEHSNYTENRTIWSDLVINNILSFEKTLGKHSIDATLGMSYENYTYTTSGGKGNDVIKNPSSGAYLWTLNNVTNNKNVWGSTGGNRIMSYFARANYDYEGKYMLSGVMRIDQSSRFGLGYRTGYFPSFSAGWNIHKESFMDDISNISNLKLYGSYGEVGGNEVGDFDYMGYINTSRTAIMGSSQTEELGMIQTALSTPGLTWQTVANKNIGVDLGLFKNKVQLTIEYFTSQTRDALIYRSIPHSAGNGNYWGQSSMPANIGEFENKGLELTLSYRESEGDFKYNITGTFSTLENKVLSLGETIKQINSGVTNTMVGYPIGTFYVLQHGGIFQNPEEVANYKNEAGAMIQPGAKPGDVRWIDTNGRDPQSNKLTGLPDGKINSDDRVMSGSGIPKFDAGLNFSASYKGFDAQVSLFGQFGFKIYNSILSLLDGSTSRTNHLKNYTPWTSEGTSNTTPRAVFSEGAENFQASNIFLENGDFVRLKTLEFGYTLPKSILKDTKLRLYMQGQNLLTFTDYTGYDPEITTNTSILTRGVDWGSVPNPKSFAFGVQVVF